MRERVGLPETKWRPVAEVPTVVEVPTDNGPVYVDLSENHILRDLLWAEIP